MKIIRVDTDLVELPLPKPIGTAIHGISSVGCVMVTVSTEAIQGRSHIFTINAERLDSFDAMVRGLGDTYVVGEDVRYTERMWSHIWRAINPSGHAGVTIAALSALDVACWDAKARALNQPLHHLFGAVRDSVPTYASSGLWLTQPIAELIEEAESFVEAGFKAVKVRVGAGPEIDRDRVAAVRNALGEAIRILVDANQAYDVKTAIRLARLLEPLSVYWLEEPVATYDRSGHARVRDATTIKIASGETEYTHLGAHEMLSSGAVDVFMPDLQRIGGYTNFRRVAAIAAAYNTPISSHFFTEHSLAMAGSLPGCDLVEHVDWFAPLFNESLQLADGELIIPDRAGCGFTYDLAAIEYFRLS